MAGLVLGQRANVRDDDAPFGHARGEFLDSHLLDLRAIAEVGVGEHLDGGHVLGGNVADGAPELDDTIARRRGSRPALRPGGSATSPAWESTCRC